MYRVLSQSTTASRLAFARWETGSSPGHQQTSPGWAMERLYGQITFSFPWSQCVSAIVPTTALLLAPLRSLDNVSCECQQLLTFEGHQV
jgi:hypothetical protein